MTEKGNKLTGGAATDEALDSSPTILQPQGGQGIKGLQQHFTTPALAKAIATIINKPQAIAFDLTAGDGALLQPWQRRFGIEVDSDHITSADVQNRSYHAIRGDVQRIVPLIHALDIRFPVVVINPPWGLKWDDKSYAKAQSSTLLGYRYAHRMLTAPGIGAIVCGTARYDREIAKLSADDPAGQRVFLRIALTGEVFPGVKVKTTIAFFTDKVCAEPLTKKLDIDDFFLMVPGLAAHQKVRDFTSRGLANPYLHSLREKWEAAGEEYKYRAETAATLRARDYDVSLEGGKLKVDIRPLVKISLRYEQKQWLERLNNVTPTYFGLNRKDWRQLKEISEKFEAIGGFRIEPKCEARIVAAIEEASMAIAPLYPIRPQQRLAYLEDVDRITCRATVDPADYPTSCPDGKLTASQIERNKRYTRMLFTEGATYPVDCQSSVMTQHSWVVKQTNSGTKEVEVERHRKILRITIGKGYGKRTSFTEDEADFDFIVKHFDVPNPGDVSTAHPEDYKAALRLVKSVEKKHLTPRGFNLREFQREDIARLLTKRSGCLAWEQGLGKTLAAFVYALCCVERGAEDLSLFIVPQDIVPQWQREASKFFGRELRVLGAGAQRKGVESDMVPGLALESLEQAQERIDGDLRVAEDAFDAAETSEDEIEARQMIEACEYAASVIEVGRTSNVSGAIADCLDLVEDIRNGWRGWVITWYEALSRNGRINDSMPRPLAVGHRRVKRYIAATWGYVPVLDDKGEPVLTKDGEPVANYEFIPSREFFENVPLTSEHHCPQCMSDTADGWNPRSGRCGAVVATERHGYTRVLVDIDATTGEPTGKLQVAAKSKRSFRRGGSTPNPSKYSKLPDANYNRKCGYVHVAVKVKPVYSYLLTLFKKGCIIIDEGTKIKGNDTLMGKSVRGLKARHRLLMTGTPIKNYITSSFWLLWWALGDNSIRFPYAYEGGYDKWAEDYAVIEQSWTEKSNGERRKGAKKILPEITNVLRLWRLLSSSIIRRRMDDTGEPIQSAKFQPVKVPFGVEQMKMYSDWLNGDNFAAFYLSKHPDTKIPMARLAKMGAMLGQNWKLEFATCAPDFETDGFVPYKHGANNWTPKNLRVLEIALDHVRKGDKVLIGSPLMAHGPWYAEMLKDAGVNALHIVDTKGKMQTKSPKKRAGIVADFVNNGADVLCAGIQALNLGHNLDVANVVILAGLPWDMSTFDQFIKRVRRLTSKKPIHIYIVMAESSIDVRKWDLVSSQIASTDLALDGYLRFAHEESVSPQQILNEMMERGIQADGTEIRESTVQAQWVKLCADHIANAPVKELTSSPFGWRINGVQGFGETVIHLGDDADSATIPMDLDWTGGYTYEGRGTTWVATEGDEGEWWLLQEDVYDALEADAGEGAEEVVEAPQDGAQAL